MQFCFVQSTLDISNIILDNTVQSKIENNTSCRVNKIDISVRRLESDTVQRAVADDTEGNQHGLADGHAVLNSRLGSVFRVRRDFCRYNVFGRLKRSVSQFHVCTEYIPHAVTTKCKYSIKNKIKC